MNTNTKISYKLRNNGTERFSAKGGKKPVNINVNNNYEVGNGVITTFAIIVMAPVVKEISHATCHVAMMMVDGIGNVIGSIINRPKKNSSASKPMEAEEE